MRIEVLNASVSVKWRYGRQQKSHLKKGGSYSYARLY